VQRRGATGSCCCSKTDSRDSITVAGPSNCSCKQLQVRPMQLMHGGTMDMMSTACMDGVMHWWLNNNGMLMLQ
jgi:hypothetical protein